MHERLNVALRGSFDAKGGPATEEGGHRRGKNSSGQVGQGLGIVHDQPTVLSRLEGANVAAVAAGVSHSIAVVDGGGSVGGVAFSWGSGGDGRLGHGDCETTYQPNRIEALVGQTDLRTAAAGHAHTLLLDAHGAVYTCGNNLQGQCGHGTSLQAIANQQRAEWEAAHVQPQRTAAAQTAVASPGSPSPSGTAAGDGWTTPQQEQRMLWARYMQPHSLQGEGERTLESAKSPRSAPDLPGGSFGLGLQQGSPFQQNTLPMRVGAGLSNWTSDGPSSSGLGDEAVTSVTASKYFSAVSTASGRVLTFGGGFSGELGSERSWGTAPSPVDGPVLEAIQRDGGARKVCAGGTFCIALTCAGTAIAWGSLPGSPEARQRGAASRAVRVEGLPPLIHVAAGYSFAAMSDGQRVWAMGRWLNPDDSLRTCGVWGKPAEVFAADGIVSLDAGAQSTAVVTSSGDLHVWGKLLSEEDVRVLRLKNAARDFGPRRPAGTAPWEGLGSFEPQRIGGLGRVHAISLGFKHALAVVE